MSTGSCPSLPCHGTHGDDLVLGVEQRGFNAWPARHSVLLGDWLLRASDGYTKRANSANALVAHARLGELLPEIEAFYAGQGLPAIVRLSPLAGAGVDAQLEQAGYRWLDPSLLMRMPLAADDWRHGPCMPGPVRLRMHAEPVPDWLRGFAAAQELLPAEHARHDHMLRSIAWPAAFAMLEVDGEPVGLGLAVLERGAVGLYDIIVAPAWRGRGLGRALVKSLLQWAHDRGAQWADLQVREPNQVARGLYEALGFRTIYGYHYRLRDALP